MKNKIVFASGLAVGYVFGTRAGRESYEKLKTKANELWNNPKVQETVSDTTETLKNKAPDLQDQASEAAKKAQDKVRGKSPGGQGGGDQQGGDERNELKTPTTGPSGGNPWQVEEPPFENQSPETRPNT